MGQIHIVPPVHIPIPTKMGSRMGGEFTYQPTWDSIGFDNHSQVGVAQNYAGGGGVRRFWYQGNHFGTGGFDTHSQVDLKDFPCTYVDNPFGEVLAAVEECLAGQDALDRCLRQEFTQAVQGTAKTLQPVKALLPRESEMDAREKRGFPDQFLRVCRTGEKLKDDSATSPFCKLRGAAPEESFSVPPLKALGDARVEANVARNFHGKACHWWVGENPNVPPKKGPQTTFMSSYVIMCPPPTKWGARRYHKLLFSDKDSCRYSASKEPTSPLDN